MIQDSSSLKDVPSETIELFKQALPYFEKAYEVDKTHENLKEALLGTYFALNDTSKYNLLKAE